MEPSSNLPRTGQQSILEVARQRPSVLKFGYRVVSGSGADVGPTFRPTTKEEIDIDDGDGAGWPQR